MSSNSRKIIEGTQIKRIVDRYATGVHDVMICSPFLTKGGILPLLERFRQKETVRLDVISRFNEIDCLSGATDPEVDYAEDQAERTIPMTMEDWAGKLNAFLRFNEREILDHPGTVTQEIAKAFTESEYEKYRVVQDRLFESDFDRHIKKLLEDGKSR